MTTRDFTANVISASKVVPDGNFKDSKASGVWDLNEALDLIKGGNWPNAANFNPSSFVDGLFQTTLWDGTGSSQTITNNINISGKGGLVWIKRRDGTDWHNLYDTERGAPYYLNTNRTDAQGNGGSSYLTALNNNGFTLGGGGWTNQSSAEYVGWTFRKQPKFFDVVKYSGSGESGQTINHSLGVAPGMVIVKDMSATSSWYVYHRSLNSGEHLKLNSTNGVSTDSNYEIGKTTASSTEFSIDTGSEIDASGNDYIAYFFAHNDSDGGFGEPGDQDIIKCGTYTGNAGNPQVIDVGFEPQFLMVKAASTTGNWFVLDNMRGVLPNADYGSDNQTIYWNTNGAEFDSGNFGFFETGFTAAQSSTTNGSGVKFIYMAIRRGGMQTPTSASDVFSTQLQNAGGSYTKTTGFVADMILQASRDTTLVKRPYDRLRGGSKYLETSDNTQEASGGTMQFDNNTGYTGSTTLNTVDWVWKRARGYFDVLRYSGTGSNRTISHNLGAAPEMMWVKKLSGANNWKTFHSSLGGTKSMELNTTVAAETNGSSLWNSTAPTASVISLGTAGDTNSGVPHNYIAYLFATVAGVSKVGSFTQSGATNVDCGFTGDTPAFILIKRTDDTGDWYIFDSERGIVAGNDPYLELNSTDAEVTNTDIVDPYSGGFATTSSLTNGDYIFYAIAATS